MSNPAISPEQLASALAARLIHDLIGPASGIVSAFDLIGDPGAAAMREEALALADDSARRLVDLLILSRTLYTQGVAMASADLGAMGQRLFDGSRATLELAIDVDPVPATGVRVVLGLLQIAAATVAAGGEVAARLTSTEARLVFEGRASGPRLRLAPEILAGLAGDGPDREPAHRWSAAYVVGAIARAAGGEVKARADPGVFAFRADIDPETVRHAS